MQKFKMPKIPKKWLGGLCVNDKKGGKK